MAYKLNPLNDMPYKIESQFESLSKSLDFSTFKNLTFKTSNPILEQLGLPIPKAVQGKSFPSNLIPNRPNNLNKSYNSPRIYMKSAPTSLLKPKNVSNIASPNDFLSQLPDLNSRSHKKVPISLINNSFKSSSSNLKNSFDPNSINFAIDQAKLKSNKFGAKVDPINLKETFNSNNKPYVIFVKLALPDTIPYHCMHVPVLIRKKTDKITPVQDLSKFISIPEHIQLKLLTEQAISVLSKKINDATLQFDIAAPYSFPIIYNETNGESTPLFADADEDLEIEDEDA